MKKSILFICILLVSGFLTIGQSDTSKVFTLVEEQPIFPGGETALMNYLGSNITYPMNAKQKGIQGTVFITFIVETDGSVSNASVLRGIGGGCDEEALRVVSNMPKWTPGRHHGIPVRVLFNIPIRFVLMEGNQEPIQEYLPPKKILTDFEIGQNALYSGDCEEANQIFNRIYSKNINEEITAELHYNMAYVKLCLKDSIEFCHYLYLASIQNHSEAFEMLSNKCKTFDYERYVENKEVLETLMAHKNKNDICEEVYTIPDVQAIFPGDIVAMQSFIENNLIYPEQALDNKVNGRVFLTFIVTEIGKIENIVVLKGLGYGCDEEAVRIIESMPQWTPGILNGQNVCVQYNLSISFSVDN